MRRLPLALSPLLVLIPALVHGQDGARLLVVNKGEATVSVVDVREGREITRIPTGNGPHEVAVLPDGRTAVVTNYGTAAAPGNTLTVIDLARLEAAGTIDLGDQRRPHGITWLFPGNRVAVTTEGNGTLTIVDVAARRVVTAVPTGAEVSHQVAIAPGCRRAFVANIGSGSVTAVDLGLGAVARTVPTGRGAEGVAVTPDRREVWVTNRAENTITVVDAATLDLVDTIPSADFPIRVVFTPDGSRALVTHARSAELRVFDVAGRAAVATIRIAPPLVEGREQVLAFQGSALPVGVLADPDGRHAYVAASSADVVAVVDLEAATVVRLIPVGREPDGLAWVPAGR